jgi:hypothetical protein
VSQSLHDNDCPSTPTGVHQRPCLAASFSQGLDQAVPIILIVHNPFPSIPSCHDMVNRSGILNPWVPSLAILSSTQTCQDLLADPFDLTIFTGRSGRYIGAISRQNQVFCQELLTDPFLTLAKIDPSPVSRLRRTRQTANRQMGDPGYLTCPSFPAMSSALLIPEFRRCRRSEFEGSRFSDDRPVSRLPFSFRLEEMSKVKTRPSDLPFAGSVGKIGRGMRVLSTPFVRVSVIASDP